jgi:hypothetical protein
MRLCRRDHMLEDGRLERFLIAGYDFRRQIQPPKPCCNCTRPFKPLRQGRCLRCYKYYRNHGYERFSATHMFPMHVLAVDAAGFVARLIIRPPAQLPPE